MSETSLAPKYLVSEPGVPLEDGRDGVAVLAQRDYFAH